MTAQTNSGASPKGCGRASGKRPGRVTALVASVGLVLLTSACATTHSPELGQLTATPTSTASPTPTPIRTVLATAPAPVSTVRVSGTGTYVYSSTGVLATVVAPADRTQEDVAMLQNFLRASHSPKLQVMSVTVTNHSAAAFDVSGFQVQGEPQTVTLYTVPTFMSLALARLEVAGDPLLVVQATTMTLTSPLSVPPGQKMTVLVATAGGLTKITGITYTPPGGAAVALKPLWLIRSEQAKMAREQAKAAAALARQQKREAESLIRREARAAAAQARALEDEARVVAKLGAGA